MQTIFPFDPPVDGEANSSQGGSTMFYARFTGFLAHPFSNENTDALDWFLRVGLILSFLIIWKLIFNHIQEVL